MTSGLSRPLRVLLDLSVLSAPTLSRGIGRYVTSLVSALHERAANDPSLEVMAIFERPTLRAPRVTSDISELLDGLDHRRKALSLWGRPRGGAGSLVRAVRASQADVVHSLDPLATPSRELSCPWVITCHHLESRLDAGKWHGASARVSYAERMRYARADRVIAISRATAQELIARLDVPRERISVVHHGVSLRRWSPDAGLEEEGRRRTLGVHKRPYLLCVGAVDQRKNVEAVFEGLARARKLIGSEDLTVVWAGRLDRPERQRLLRKAGEAGVRDALLLLGYVTDHNLAALYRGATALVFASRREGFGYPVVEAMAAGCPVVTSNCSSLVEVASDAALRADPDDTSAIADAIVLLSDDNAERRRLSEAGRARAQLFSLAKMVEGTVQAYRAAVE